MMNKQKNTKHSNKVTDAQKKHEETWLGNPDDHEPTNKVTKEEINP